MTGSTISGFTLLRPPDDATSLPRAWRAFLAGQTLPEIAPDDRHACLFAYAGLPDDVPAHLDRALLERMAWALLARPHCDGIVYPLFVSIVAQSPLSIGPCTLEQRGDALAQGFVAILHRRVRAMLPDDGWDVHALQALLASEGAGVEICSRALLDERFALLPPVTPAGGSRTPRLRERLPPRHRAWLKRLYLRLRSFVEPAATVDHERDEREPLALRTSWEPTFPTPDVAVHVPPVGDRIPVWLALHWLELGGAEKFILDLIDALPRDRYAIYVTTDLPSENPWVESIRDRVEEIVHFPEFLPDYMIGVFCEHWVRTRRLRLLHINHAPRVYESLFHIRRFHPTLRVLQTLHILELPPHSGGYPEWSMANFGVFIDHHHVISDQLRRFLVERWKVPAERIDMVRIGVDVERFDPDAVPAGIVRTWLGLPDGAVLVGFIGRFAPQKQPLEFVRFAKLVHDQWRLQGYEQPLHFVMAGSGTLRAKVEEAIRRAGLADAVHVVGELSDTRPIYKDCDIIAMPSENEGLALVTYEAMAMATPVFFTDVGAQAELLGPEQLVGRRAEVAPGLADRVWPFLVDAERRRALGEGQRAHIARHGRLSERLDRMLALYDRLLTGAQADPVHAAEPATLRCDAVRDGRQHAAGTPPSVAAAVVSYNHRDALLRLLEFLDARGIPTFVTENGSSDGTREALAGRFASVSVLESPANLGGCGGFNCAVLAALAAGTDYVLLIDDDALPVGDCIERLAHFLDTHPTCVFAAPAVYITAKPDVLQEAGGGIDFASNCPVQAWHRFAIDPELPSHIDIDYASACCLMVRAGAVQQLGVMDWSYFIFSDDVDWSIRLQRAFGKQAACVPGARALHDFPWAKPFSPMRLYYFQRNGLYMLSRLREGAASAAVVETAVLQLVRRCLYAWSIGDREAARTLRDALRDAWRRQRGKWQRPVPFPNDRRALDAAFFRRHRITRVLVDVTIEDFDAAMLATLRRLGGDGLTVDVLCDRHRTWVYRERGLFASVYGRSEGTFGALKDYWYARRRGYDLSITDAAMEPRRPASMAGRRAAFFHDGALYEAAAGGLRGCAAHVASGPLARVAAAVLHRRFLVPPPPGLPPADARPVLERIGVRPEVGQPWAREWPVPFPVARAAEAAVLRVAAPHVGRAEPGWTPLQPAAPVSSETLEDDYATWRIARQRSLSTKYPSRSHGLTFSIVVDVTGTHDAAWFAACVASIREQRYPAWELAVVEHDDVPPDLRKAVAAAGVADVVEAVPGEDPWVARRRAASRTSGQYVIFLDAADALDVHALAALAEAAGEPEADVLYADEDRIDASGVLCKPWFKPDYAPVWLGAGDRMGRPVALRRETFEALGTGDPIRRAAAVAQRVVHVADVLCHRHEAAGGEAPAVPRSGISAATPAISVLVVRDGPTPDAELHALWADSECLVVPHAVGGAPVARRLSALAERTRGDVLLIVSSELRPVSSWREALLPVVLDPNVGIVGGRLRYADGLLHSAGLTLGVLGAVGRWHHGWHADDPGYGGWIAAPHEVSAVPWQFLAIRRDVLLRAGAFDSAFVDRGFDVDLALRLTTGFGLRHRYVPETGGTFVFPADPGVERWSLDDLTLLWERWGRVIRRGDPYLNPNLSLLTEDVRLVTQHESDLRARGALMAYDRPTAALLLRRFPGRHARPGTSPEVRYSDSRAAAASPTPALESL